MSMENVLTFEREQDAAVTQPTAHDEQGSAWLTNMTADGQTPPPPPPMPEVATPVTDAATPPPPPAMPDASLPATTMAAPASATTMAVPVKSTGGWEVDSYRLRSFSDAVVRARSYLDAVRMKVDRMQGATLDPQLGTSPVGQQLAKKFDDRLNSEAGLRTMLTEAMKRMERFVTTAEEAARAYEQAEETALETFDNYKYEVDWEDEPLAEPPADDGHDGGHHHDHDHDHGDDADDADDEEQAGDDTEEEPPAGNGQGKPG